MKYFFLALLISSYSFGQEDIDQLVAVSFEACDCISEIKTDITKEEKSENINSCIESANMAYQLKQGMAAITQKLNDTISASSTSTKPDTLNTQVKEFNIAVNNDNYEAVLEYLNENCGNMRSVYFSDDVASKNSYSDKDEAIEFYNKGLNAYDNQDYKLAISLYKQAVKKDKKFAFAWDNLGLSYRAIGDYKNAINCYKKSLKIDKTGKVPLTNIAIAYEYLNDYENAKKAYINYGKIHKNDPETFYGLGRIYSLEGDYENGLDNMIQAYILYIEIDSPYKLDASKNISFMYQELEKQGNLDLFFQLAKKHKLNVKK